MEIAVSVSWAALVAVHTPPAIALVAPNLIQRLYGVAPGGDVGLLLVHRAALFLAVAAVCFFAMLEPTARQAGSLVAAISLITFLFLYVRGGSPKALRTIALVDLVALAPLGVVLFDAWAPSWAP